MLSSGAAYRVLSFIVVLKPWIFIDKIHDPFYSCPLVKKIINND